MDMGQGGFGDPSAGNYWRSINDINLPSPHSDYNNGQACQFPMLAWQPILLQPDKIVQQRSLPLYTRTTSDNNFSKVSPIFSSADNVYPRRWAPSNLFWNWNEFSCIHTPTRALNRALHRDRISNSSYNSQLFGVRTPQASNNISTNSFEQDISNYGNISFGMRPYSHQDVFAYQDLRMCPTAPISPKVHSLQFTNQSLFSNSASNSSSLERSLSGQSHYSGEEYLFPSRSLSANSTHDANNIGLANSPSHRCSTCNVVTNQSSFGNAASNPCSLRDSEFIQLHRAAEKSSTCPSHLFANSTQEVDYVLRLEASPSDRCCTTNIAANQLYFSNSALNSPLFEESQGEQSQCFAEQYYQYPSRQLYANSTQEVGDIRLAISPSAHSTTNVVTNQSAFGNAASNPSSLRESEFRQSQRAAEKYSTCPSHLFANSTQEIDYVLRLEALPSDRCGTTNIVTNQKSFWSPSNSASLRANQTSYIDTKQHSPSSSSHLYANTAQEILTKPSYSGAFLDCDSVVKDNLDAFSDLYKEAVRELFAASDGNILNDIIETYACPKPTETANAAEEVATQLSPTVETVERPRIKSFCKFCYRNQEPEYVYTSHQFRNERRIVTCPVLRKYVCPICGIRGDYSHTLKYCPLADKENARSTQCRELPGFMDSASLSQDSKKPSHSTPKNTSSEVSEFSHFDSFLTSENTIDQKSVINQYPTALDAYEEASSTTGYKTKEKEMNTQCRELPGFNESASLLEDSKKPSHSTPKSTSAEVSEFSHFDSFLTSENAIDQKSVINQYPTALDADQESPSTTEYKTKKNEICKFCRKNNRSQRVYSSHKLRDEKGDIECRFLRSYVCNFCGASGNTAHTRKYCPENTYEDFIRQLED